MDFWIYYFFSALWLLIGLVAGYRWHAWEVKHCQPQSEPITYTQGAAYDAMEEPTTDYDTEAVRKLLNSW